MKEKKKEKNATRERRKKRFEARRDTKNSDNGISFFFIFISKPI